jgi:RNA polymerase sigma factor (sigma-70 family)
MLPRRERTTVPDESTLRRFEQAVLPHLPAAYNLARWLTRNDHDAEDVVQEAYMRAFRFFDGFHGGDSRPWLFAIVRHTCNTWLQHNRGHEPMTGFDEDIHRLNGEATNPETLLLQRTHQLLLRQALEALPVEFREVMVFRELEGLSYKEIAAIADLPVGSGDETMVTRQGYHLAHWRVSGMSYWVVSNLNQGELHEFVRAVRQQTSAVSR